MLCSFKGFIEKIQMFSLLYIKWNFIKILQMEFYINY